MMEISAFIGRHRWTMWQHELQATEFGHNVRAGEAIKNDDAANTTDGEY